MKRDLVFIGFVFICSGLNWGEQDPETDAVAPVVRVAVVAVR